MAIERWGSLSVRDHVNTEEMIANVLLYDRLVMPVFTEEQFHRQDERAYWEKQKWDPDLQSKRLMQLGELAIRKPWDTERRVKYKKRVDELRAEKADEIDYFGITQEIIGSKDELRKVKLPENVTSATTVAAYNSEAGFREDFAVGKPEANLAEQAYLLGRELVVPAIVDLEDSLKRAIDLSLEDDFRVKRARLFNWQEEFAERKRLTAEQAVDEIALMTKDYNLAVTKAYDEVKKKCAFTLFGVALTVAGIGTSVLIPVAGIALGLVRFVTLDAKPVIQAGDAEPAAMFHDIRRKIGTA